MSHSGESLLAGQTFPTTTSIGRHMHSGVIRRYFVWACVAASFAAIILATRHMDYSVDPPNRAGAAATATPTGMRILSIVIKPVKDRSGPCLAPTQELAFLR